MLQPHIQLDESVQCRCAILPGDPGRLDRIALQLENVKELAYNREFRSLRGLYKGVPVLAIGVPTVVEGATLAADLLGCDRLPQSAPGRDILVTPRDIDRQVADLSKILGYGISMALQPGLGLEELELLLS